MTIYRGPGGTGEATTDSDVTEVRVLAAEAAASAAAAREYVSSSAPLRNILGFNAVGDGVTVNDIPFEEMEESPYDFFYVPEGNFKISFNNLTKTYLGPGRIIYGDGVIQECQFEGKNRQRNETGPLEISSPSDILLKPVGTVNTNGKRISGIGVAAGQNDALSPAAMATGIINGIKLTNQVSADSNVLDWYEEGSFTPVVRGVTTAGTATYPGLQYGRFTRIGNQCRVRIRVNYSLTGSSGAVVVSNLPFPASSDSSVAGGVGTGFTNSYTFTGQLQFYAIGSYLYPVTFTSGGTATNPVDTAGELDVDITYFIA